jgi:hypothetical protein
MPAKPIKLVPMYIEARDIARLAKWRTNEVAKLWQRNGILMHLGRRAVTTPAKLMGEFPEQLEALLDMLERMNTDKPRKP